MKTTLTAIVVLMAIVPNLAVAGDPLHDAVIPHINPPVVINVDKPTINPPVVIDVGSPIINPPVVIDVGGSNGPYVHKVALGVLLACAVRGTPSEFPDDLVITNLGLKTVDAGSQLKWTTKSPKLHGVVTLTKALAPGQSVKLNGVLEGGLSPDTQCSVQVL
jgi:hypothetical protein